MEGIRGQQQRRASDASMDLAAGDAGNLCFERTKRGGVFSWSQLASAEVVECFVGNETFPVRAFHANHKSDAGTCC